MKSGSSWVYYDEKGKVSTKKSDIVQGTIDGVNAWYYIENGKAVLDHNGVDHNINGWWYVKKGKVDFSYNGFAKNVNGWWYIENGKVTFNRNDVIHGKVNGEYAWWNVKGSKVIFNESIEQNINGWWYIKDGKVDFTKTSVEQNHSGWWYVKKGKVDFNYTGFAKNKNGWWYIENGKVTFNRNDVIHGKVKGEYAWWNVKGSKVTFNESIEQNTNGWWYIKDGKVDFTKTSVEHNHSGWWYVKNGKVDFSYNGIAENKNGKWFIVNGKVDFGANGWKTVNGEKYHIVGGKVSAGVQYIGSMTYNMGGTGVASEHTYKIGAATYLEDANSRLIGVDYEVKKWINQLGTYGSYPMACGAAAAYMAFQANDYGLELSGKSGWESFIYSCRQVRGSSFGKRYGNGIMTAAQLKACVQKNPKTQNVPMTVVTGSSVSLDRIKDSLTHGQTAAVVVGLGSSTHWIAVTGWYHSGNTTMYRIADSWPKDGKTSTNYVTSMTKREDAYYSDKLSASDLYSILKASNVISYHNGGQMLLFGNYR